MESLQTKCCVVGGGPAGMMLGYLLARAGVEVIVLEKHRDFNRDFRVTFTEDQVAAGRIDYNFGTIVTDPRYIDRELPGVSVFYKDAAGAVFHTYSTYARGLDMLLGANHYLDLTPEGRNDAAYPNWPRRRDEYDKEGSAQG